MVEHGGVFRASVVGRGEDRRRECGPVGGGDKIKGERTRWEADSGPFLYAENRRPPQVKPRNLGSGWVAGGILSLNPAKNDVLGARLGAFFLSGVKKGQKGALGGVLGGRLELL